jgi:hypothetical protein
MGGRGGLKAGDQLIVEGQMNVHPGDAATARPPQQITVRQNGSAPGTAPMSRSRRRIEPMSRFFITAPSSHG